MERVVVFCDFCCCGHFFVMKTVKKSNGLTPLEKEWVKERHRESERKRYQKRKLANPELVKEEWKWKKRNQRAQPGFREKERNTAMERLKKAKAVEAFVRKQEVERFRRQNPKMTRAYAAMTLRAMGKAVTKFNIEDLLKKQYKVLHE